MNHFPRAKVIFVLLVCLSAAGIIDGCAGQTVADIERNLKPGMELGEGAKLGRARVYPLEPMSSTSTRCAIRLIHAPTGIWVDAFVEPGNQEPAVFDNGDIHFPDGRTQQNPPEELRLVMEKAWARLQQSVKDKSGNEVLRACEALDRSLPPAGRMTWFGLLALSVLGAAGLLYRRCRWIGRFLLFTGVSLLAVSLWPLLHGDSLGSQEVQRLLSALQPAAEIIQGQHGDPRHPAGLFLLYAPVAQASGSVFGMRVFGFLFLLAGLLAWVLARFSQSPGQALLGLGMLFHPVLLKGIMEVGPFAFYSAGLLLMLLAVWRASVPGRWAFSAGLAGQAFMAATNHVGVAVGAAVMLVALFRHWHNLNGRQLLLRSAAILLVTTPFCISVFMSLGEDATFRAFSSLAPELAWGEQDSSILARGILGSTFFGVFMPLSISIVLLLGWRAVRVCRAGLLLIGLALGLLGMLLLLTPVFRVQPYYALYAVPLLMVGLGCLIDSLDGWQWRLTIGLIALSLLAFDAFRLAPLLARNDPDPAAPVAVKAKALAGSCPTLVTATSDLMIPLVPYLMDLALEPDPQRLSSHQLPGLPDASRWSIESAGLDLLSLFHRHRLPSNPQEGFLQFLTGRSSGECIQVLYDRRFPLTDVYRYLVSECTAEVDVEWFVLFRCNSC